MTRLFRDFQYHVTMWMTRCFGTPPVNKGHWIEERCDRFIEEALELAQACGYDADRVATLTQYVFNRPVGKKEQEVGGVMVTLAALCAALPVNIADVAYDELFRISDPDIMQRIRDKQASKNDLHSPLPGGCPCEPSGSDGLRCPDNNGKLLCSQDVRRKLDAPARVGSTTFSAGVDWSTVVNAALRAYATKPLAPEQVAALGEKLERINQDNASFTCSALIDADATIAQLKNVLNSIKMRVHFIDMPSETMWNAGTPEKPNWVPDWREEIGLIEQALHGTSPPELTRRDTLSRWQIAQPRAVPEPVAQGEADADYSRDLRNLIYIDTQFNMRDETDLKLAEIHALEARGWIVEGSENNEYETTAEADRVIETTLAALQLGAVVDGWVLVPREPTAEMMSAGQRTGWTECSASVAFRTYQAMLAAAPSQGEPKGFIIDGLSVKQLARKLIEAGDGVTTLQELCQQQGYTLMLDPSQQPHMRLCSDKFASAIWTHNADGTVTYEQLPYTRYPDWVTQSTTFNRWLGTTMQQQTVIDYFVDNVPDFIYQIFAFDTWKDVSEVRYLEYDKDQRRVVLVVPAP